MSQQTDLQTLTLAGIAHRCAHETDRFFQRQAHDPRYCFELFRRAIAGQDQRAWELVYRQYRPLVAGWVERHSAFPSSGEEAQYFLNRAFEKMWSALNPERFGQFPNLKSLLRYLQMCVNSVVYDHVRRAELPQVELEPHALAADAPANDPLAEQILDKVQQQELWSAVTARLQDDQERMVVYGSFVLGLKPRELCAHYAGSFVDVREVYRVKENVLARLRRDAALRRILGGDA
jgi:DNA-directed RNA polymerase specialized sigma24 family protein